MFTFSTLLVGLACEVSAGFSSPSSLLADSWGVEAVVAPGTVCTAVSTAALLTAVVVTTSLVDVGEVSLPDGALWTSGGGYRVTEVVF